jgi:hypothetical protein
MVQQQMHQHHAIHSHQLKSVGDAAQPLDYVSGQVQMNQDNALVFVPGVAVGVLGFEGILVPSGLKQVQITSVLEPVGKHMDLHSPAGHHNTVAVSRMEGGQAVPAYAKRCLHHNTLAPLPSHDLIDMPCPAMHVSASSCVSLVDQWILRMAEHQTHIEANSLHQYCTSTPAY